MAIPAVDQIEIFRRAVRYLIAIERVRASAKQHNLTDEQKAQLREREATEKATAESALLKLYTEVWLPKVEASGIGLEVVAVGGRPLQTTLNEKKEARVQERVMELLTVVHQRVFLTLKPAKIVELFKLGEGSPPTLGIRTADLLNGFYSFLGFTRLASAGVLSRAIADGVKKGVFGYVGGDPPALRADGKYQVSASNVRFETEVADDEVDWDSGFIMLPTAIPQPVPTPTPSGTQGSPTGGPVAEPQPGPGGTTPQPGSGPTSTSGAQTEIQLTFSADRDQLFAAWNAVANLADLAGKVTVSLRAQKQDGFDRSKLQNGVIEPLREADLIK